MPARVLAGSGALVALLAAPATAEALPTIQPLKPCYVTAGEGRDYESEPLQIAAAGFTPNSNVDLTIDGAPVKGGSGLKIDAAGNLTIAPIKAPDVSRGSRPFTVTLTEQGNPANTVSATAKSAALSVTVRPRTAKPSDRIRFKGLGFTAEGPIYAHYLHRGKLRKTVRMARYPGECGNFKVLRRQIPIERPGLGRWVLQFDQSKEYVDPDVTDIVYVRLFIRLELVPV